MAKPASPQKHLKLYTEQPPKNVRPQIEAVACLPELFRAFQAATGWTLRYVPGSETNPPAGLTWSAPVSAGPAFAPGFLCLGAAAKRRKRRAEGGRNQRAWQLDSTTITKSRIPAVPLVAPRPSPIDRDSARRLAGSIADLLGELLQTRRALWQREAELAAGVPLVPHREEEKHLAARLEAVLRAGAEAVGGDAIALYLLDEATTELKLRCSWGLPFDRLAAPARPLQGAVADLEALLGHAVVLDDDSVMRMWNVPEDFPAAVCVPVSTPTTLLGTLWVFCNEKRDFNDRETNILEVVAGRLASDLEREMLMRAGSRRRETAETSGRRRTAAAERTAHDLAAAGRLGRGRLDGPGRERRRGVPRLVLPARRSAGRGGRARPPSKGIAGALTANAVKTAVRSHARYHRQAERILQQVNLTLWTGSAGDQHAALFCGLIETATGRVCCASAGQPSVLRLRGDGWQSLSQSSLVLGRKPRGRLRAVRPRACSRAKRW